MSEQLIVRAWGADFRPTGTAKTRTEQEAIDWMAENTPDKYPDAFYVENPGVGVAYITVDPATKTINVDTERRDAGKALREWDTRMAKSDQEMPRGYEDHLDHMIKFHSLVLTDEDPRKQRLLDKKRIRSQRPQV